jgi:D-glycero-D-manno-heptose 1,7-bisphosphate phosphatase
MPGMVPGLLPTDSWTPRRALFLDRDGVINVNHGYVHMPEQTDWVPGIFELCAAARDAGYALMVVTNQAGIARGLYSEAEFRTYTDWVHREFDARGVPLLATYFCPHHPEAGVGDYKVACNCRKPRPGMFLAAQADWNVDPARSCIIGDQSSDLQAAAAAQVTRGWQVGSEGISLVEAREALLAAEARLAG